jgi:hypothetical protein
MHDDDVNDDDVLGALRHGLSKLPVPQAPPLEAIVARGRARRRRSGLAGMSLAAAGLAIALPVIITGVNGPSSRVATSLRLGSGPVHVNLAAYSVDSNPNGTVSVTLATKGNFDPNKLRQALARAGVAAVVNVDAFCQTPVQPGGFGQVVSSGSLKGSANSSAAGAGQSAQANVTAMVIKPSAMPRRAELSIGYFPDHVAMTLVKLGGPLSCVANDPPGCNVPVVVPALNGSSASQAATSTTLPSATTTTGAQAATSTLPPAATTTVPPAATSTLPASATTSLPAGASSGAAQKASSCPAPAPGGTGDTSVTSGGTSTTVASSTTTSPAL